MKALVLVLALVFLIAAVLAATGAAHFSAILGFDGHHHVKHTIIYAVIAVLCLIWSRMGQPARA